jgi:mannose-6-phosphate isomerase
MFPSAVDEMVPTVLALGGRTVTADWGSTTLLAELLGMRPSGAPEAEVWFGAHERHPSPVEWQGAACSVLDVDAIEPPTFLVKLIAIAAPLSVQVHPDDATAAAGFALEEQAGVPRESRERRFVDASGKPELVRAITPMRILCGLRPALVSRELLSGLAPSGFDEPLALLAHGDTRLGDVVALLLRAGDRQVRTWLDALAAGSAAVIRTAEEHPDVATHRRVRLARLFADLHGRHPQDRGVLVALLLDDRDLAPGEAVYVAPGVPHAYLSGLGLEVMASSDNVLRGGMTTKQVDVDAFLSVLDASVGGGIRVGALAHRVADEVGWRRFLTPSDAFVLDEAKVQGVLRVERTGAGPAIMLCLAGAVTVRAGDGSGADLAPGHAVLLRRGLDPVEVRGDGTVVHVRAGRRPARERPQA